MGYFEQIGWSPTIGDPSFLGWFTVFAYLFTSFLCFKVRGNIHNVIVDKEQRLKRLWLLIGLLFLFLAINKQLDLQTFFTQALKFNAREQGWYENRRMFQRIFIYSVLAGGVLLLGTLTVFYSKHLRTHFIAFVGICFVLVFVFIRASSFHHVDSALTGRDSGFRLNNVLELSGIALVALNAWFLTRQPKHRKRNPNLTRRHKSPF